uniref:Venom protein n=1 Tax=Ampulex compressa TaxID=860918 RepID=A0A1W6EW83_AMPCP|nr:venom protein [Ampulex compressa]
MNFSSQIAWILIGLYAVILVAMCASTNERVIGSCIRNCAQCKKMFGPYFLGEKCAESCVKFKGKFIPDCESEESIEPFLTPFNASDSGLTNDRRICRLNCKQCKDALRQYFLLERCNAYCNSPGDYKVLPDLAKPNTLVCYLVPAPADIYTAKEDVCIVNCIQCKDMYPNVFAVGKCSEYCLSNVHNLVMPDCTVASTIVDFIYINNAAGQL